MDIEVGDWIRTKNGYIHHIEKILDYKDDWYSIEDFGNNEIIYKIQPKDIVSCDKDIIDLIEIGDIIKWEANDIGYYGVNEVIRRPETKKTLGVYPEEYDYLLPLEQLKIIKVLTREQFEENSYEVQYG